MVGTNFNVSFYTFISLWYLLHLVHNVLGIIDWLVKVELLFF